MYHNISFTLKVSKTITEYISDVCTMMYLSKAIPTFYFDQDHIPQMFLGYFITKGMKLRSYQLSTCTCKYKVYMPQRCVIQIMRQRH